MDWHPVHLFARNCLVACWNSFFFSIFFDLTPLSVGIASSSRWPGHPRPGGKLSFDFASYRLFWLLIESCSWWLGDQERHRGVSADSWSDYWPKIFQRGPCHPFAFGCDSLCFFACPNSIQSCRRTCHQDWYLTFQVALSMIGQWLPSARCPSLWSSPDQEFGLCYFEKILASCFSSLKRCFVGLHSECSCDSGDVAWVACSSLCMISWNLCRSLGFVRSVPHWLWRRLQCHDSIILWRRNLNFWTCSAAPLWSICSCFSSSAWSRSLRSAPCAHLHWTFGTGLRNYGLAYCFSCLLLYWTCWCMPCSSGSCSAWCGRDPGLSIAIGLASAGSRTCC